MSKLICDGFLFLWQAQNNEFSATFNLEDYKASREKCFKQIQAAIAKYREIKENVNEGLKFYVMLQDAITNIKQQCSDYVMTRNIQCREMIDDVQRQVAGLNFHERNSSGSSYSYTSATLPHQRSNPQPPPPETQNVLPPTQPPYYRPQPPEQTMYSQAPPPYGAPQQQPPSYHVPPGATSAPYPSPHTQQPPASHEYGQPAYPGWRGPYYNAPVQQQPGSFPRPPYTAQPPYPPHQSGYYRQQ